MSTFQALCDGNPPIQIVASLCFSQKTGPPPTRQGWFCPPTIWNTKPQLIRLAFIVYTDAMSLSDPTLINEMQIGQPAWRMALLFPPQGSWTEQEYLAIDAGRQIEFDRGCVEVLDLPTKEHQRIVRFVFLLIESFVSGRGLGEVFFAPIPVRLWDQKYREPDLVFIRQGRENVGRYPDGADLVVEVLSESPSDRKRDLETKVDEYAQAGIQEYWIVDPAMSTVMILSLVDSKYAAQSFAVGDIATSKILNGISLDVKALFESARG